MNIDTDIEKNDEVMYEQQKGQTETSRRTSSSGKMVPSESVITNRKHSYSQ